MQKETKTAVFDQKEVLEEVKSDLEAIEAFLSQKEQSKGLKEELRKIETAVETLKAVGSAIPKEVEERKEELEKAVKSVELSEKQSILLRYIQKAANLDVNPGTKDRLKGTVVITTVEGKKFEFETFKRACLHLGLEVGRDSAKRVLLRSVSKGANGLDSIQSISVGNTVVWKKTAE